MKATTLREQHPNLSDELNRQVAESALAEGALLEAVPVGGAFAVTTRNTSYRIERVHAGDKDLPFLISGHPRICPEPKRCGISGSSFGRGGMLRMGFVGRGMNMEFHVAGSTRRYTTTEVLEVREAAAAAGRAG